jgi:hypothetical protein
VGGSFFVVGSSEAFKAFVGVVLLESELDEALRLYSGKTFVWEDFFETIEESRYVREGVRVRFCWVVARMMHRRQMGSLKGVKGRTQPLEKAAIVLFYIFNQLALRHSN